jgi:hypothetical protein
MKNLLNTFALLLLSTLAFGQVPHTFTSGETISSSQMNENFNYLLSRSGGINEKTVDCGSDGNGSGIQKAIDEGFNSIIVKGHCLENLSQKTGNLLSLIILRGYHNDKLLDKIIDNSSNNEKLIDFGPSSFLKIDNLTLSGGAKSIVIQSNSTLWAENLIVENYTEKGIEVVSSSVGWLGNIKVDGTKQDTDDVGIHVSNSSYAYIFGETAVNGNNNNTGGISVGGASNIWITGNLTMDSNKQSLVIESGGAMGFSNSTTSITNSIDYGIKAYFGKFWNYGTMSISDNNDGDYAVLIDRSGAYLGNMTITGGTGNDPLIGIYNSYSTVIENSSIKNHSGNLLNINRSVVEFEGENNFSNDSMVNSCFIYAGDSTINFKGQTTLNGTNNEDCSTLSLFRSQGAIENVIITSPNDALYLVSSKFRIKGGTFSSTGGSNNAISIRENSSLRLESQNDINITSAGNDEALEIKDSSYASIRKNDGNLNISNSNPDNILDIEVDGLSLLKIKNDTTVLGSISIGLSSNLIIEENSSVGDLFCSPSADGYLDITSVINGSNNCPFGD